MKCLLSVAAVLILSLGLLANTASAANKLEERIDYENGSYAIITTITSGVARANVADSKTYTYYNSSNQRCFSYTLNATFTYDGRTASATSSSGGASIYRQGWSLSSHNEYTSGSTAYGSATFSGPNDESRPVSLSLTCDKDGSVK